MVQIQLPRAPVPMMSTSAESVHSALDLAPQFKPQEDLLKELRLTAKYSAALDCEDGAYSNVKYSEWKEMNPETTRGTYLCHNHGNNRTECLLTDMYGKSFRKKAVLLRVVPSRIFLFSAIDLGRDSLADQSCGHCAQ